MSQFRYVAKTMEGRTRRGKMNALNEKQLAQTLRDSGLFLVRADNLEGAKGARKLNARELSELNREMSNLMRSGVTLVRALDIVAEEEGQSPRVHEALRALLVEVKKGVSLSEAMEQQTAFPELMIGMIRSGEGNGNIDEVMGRLSVQYDKEYRLNMQVKSAMTYPAILAVLMVGVVGVIVGFVLPQFETLFAQMESLPLVTEILLGVSDFIVKYWYLLIIIAIAAFFILRSLLAVRAVRLRVDFLLLRMPIVGKLNKVVYTARFARTLSSLYSSGMPIAIAIRTAGGTIGNAYVEEQFEEVTSKVRSGVPLSTALRDVDGFVKKLSSSIMVGEESGRLDSMLNSIADTMEEEATEATKRLVTLLEPVMILIMAVAVGFVVAAVMLPIYQSYGAIENM